METIKINPFDLYTTEQLIAREKEMLAKYNKLKSPIVGGIEGYWSILEADEYYESIKILQEIIAERELLS